jgi:hypothetical protein
MGEFFIGSEYPAADLDDKGGRFKNFLPKK